MRRGIPFFLHVHRVDMGLPQQPGLGQRKSGPETVAVRPQERVERGVELQAAVEGLETPLEIGTGCLAGRRTPPPQQRWKARAEAPAQARGASRATESGEGPPGAMPHAQPA